MNNFNNIKSELKINLSLKYYFFYNERTKEFIQSLILYFAENSEKINFNILEFFYFNMNIINRILYIEEKIIKINPIDNKNLKIFFSCYFYLCSLIKFKKDFINFSYDFCVIKDISNQEINNSKVLQNIIKSKIILDLIDNYYENDENNDEKQCEYLKEKNKKIIKENLSFFKSLNIDKFNEENIKKNSIDGIYIEIIKALIINKKLENYEYAYNIIDQLNLEFVNLDQNIFEKIFLKLKSEEIYIKDYIISNINDLSNISKINFYFILLKYILKNSLLIYQIPFLIKTRKTIIKIIKENINQLLILNLDNNEIKERMEYIIEKITDSKYYYLKYIKLKLNEVLLYYKEILFESKKDDIKIIEEEIKNDKIINNKNYFLDFNNALKINKRIQIIKYLFNQKFHKYEIQNKEKAISEIIKYWETIEEMINAKNHIEIKNDKNMIFDFFKEKNNEKILLKIFNQEIYDSFIQEIIGNSTDKKTNKADIDESFDKYSNSQKTESNQSKDLIKSRISDNYSSILEFNTNSSRESKNINNENNLNLEILKNNINKSKDTDNINLKISDSSQNFLFDNDKRKESKAMFSKLIDGNLIEKKKEKKLNEIKEKENNEKESEEKKYLKSIKNIKEIKNGYYYILYINKKNLFLRIMNKNSISEYKDINLSLDTKSIIPKIDKYQKFEFYSFNSKSVINHQIDINGTEKVTEYNSLNPGNFSSFQVDRAAHTKNILFSASFSLNGNKDETYIIGSNNGAIYIEYFLNNYQQTNDRALYFKPINGGISIDNDNIVLMFNNVFKTTKNLIFTSLSKKYDYIEKEINYSINKCEHSLSTLKLQNNGNLILLCACKKYLKGQKNGILVINYNFYKNNVYIEDFYDTKNFEIYCFCQIFYRKNISVLINSDGNTKIFYINYFLVGGFDIKKCHGEIKLYKAFYNKQKKKVEIEFVEEVTYKEGKKYYKSPICCLLQLKENYRIIVGCFDGNFDVIEPLIEKITSFDNLKFLYQLNDK